MPQTGSHPTWQLNGVSVPTSHPPHKGFSWHTGSQLTPRLFLLWALRKAVADVEPATATFHFTSILDSLILQCSNLLSTGSLGDDIPEDDQIHRFGKLLLNRTGAISAGHLSASPLWRAACQEQILPRATLKHPELEREIMAKGKRFYEINGSVASKLAKDCREQWSLPDEAEIGPINTNYHTDSEQPIDLVVVCESPSFAEVENGYPARGDTGLKIFNSWLASRGQARAVKAQFDYSQLAANGIYVTNLVRCQADWIPKDCYARGARLLTSIKDKRVINAWPLNREFLATELQEIAKLHKDASVLFACGTRFNVQVKEATEFARTAGLKWLASFHPSRLAKGLSRHYDPQQWNGQQGTFPSDRGEKNRN